MLKMVKQSAILAKVPVKNELDESRLNFFMNTGTSDKFRVRHQTSLYHRRSLILRTTTCLSCVCVCIINQVRMAVLNQYPGDLIIIRPGTWYAVQTAVCPLPSSQCINPCSCTALSAAFYLAINRLTALQWTGHS